MSEESRGHHFEREEQFRRFAALGASASRRSHPRAELPPGKGHFSARHHRREQADGKSDLRLLESERFTALMKFQAERSHRLYDEALALLPPEDRNTQKPALMVGNIYRRLLREVEAGGFQVLHQRISLTPLRKLWIACQTNWRGR